MIYRLPSFDRAFQRLTAPQQAEVRSAVEQIPQAFGHPHRHAGLGLRPFGPYFECRVGRALRVLFLAEQADFILATVGNHNQVRAYLKNNR